MVKLFKILPILLLFSCEPINDETVQFTINKGMHLSTPLIIKSGKFKSFECDVQFTESCKYQISPSDQGDQNKLFGFGFEPKIPNNNPAHDNSIRWTWRYEKGNEVLLIPYWYINHQRIFGFKHQKAVKINDVVKLAIHVSRENYIMLFNDEKIVIPHNQIIENAWVLTPYFGGNNKAPHTIKINFLKFKIQ